ncbi:glutathione S-transferase family protein [Pseudorhodoplanes sp.]|uniref:glutathione S-transferase family protein n=1 Tax=Pseudorhodoplanes sp. TaxID=1934341 RepID=UPI003D0D477B
MITLYSWGTPNGNKLHIILEELDLRYRLVPVNLARGEQRNPEFVRISPNGKIPAIVDPHGPGGRIVTLAESGAILIYLAEKHGRFLPGDPLERLAALQWIMFQMGHVGPVIGQLHHFQATAPSGNEYAIERYRKEGERLLDVVEARLRSSEFLASSEYSIADICTWPWIRSWVHTTKQAIGARPALARWHEAIGERPAVQKAVRIYDELRRSGDRT